MSQPDKSKPQFILTGFTQQDGFRVFSFLGVSPDRTRIVCAVRVALDDCRKYGIHLQDLPLLCREVLDQRYEAGGKCTFTYSTKDMIHFAEEVAARTAASRVKRKPPPRNAVSEAGSSWSGQVR